jgi:chemotaxis protein CheX
MGKEFVSAFATALGETYSTMLGCEVSPTSDVHIPEQPNFKDVSGVIDMTGRAEGLMVISLAKEVALKSASAMLMAEYDKINADVIDAIGEIANMVAGSAKAKLSQYCMNIGLPSVITGNGHEVNFPSEVVPHCLNFDSPWGPLTLTVGLVVVDEPVAV